MSAYPPISSLFLYGDFQRNRVIVDGRLGCPARATPFDKPYLFQVLHVIGDILHIPLRQLRQLPERPRCLILDYVKKLQPLRREGLPERLQAREVDARGLLYLLKGKGSAIDMEHAYSKRLIISIREPCGPYHGPLEEGVREIRGSVPAMILS